MYSTWAERNKKIEMRRIQLDQEADKQLEETRRIKQQELIKSQAKYSNTAASSKLYEDPSEKDHRMWLLER